MRRFALIAALTAAMVLLGGGLASAHVTVNPATAAPNSFLELAFRAPNETAKANVTKLVVHLPAAHPLGSVSPRAIPGWSITTTTTATLAKPIVTDDGTTTEYLDSITWTATAGGIPPEQYQDFDISAGKLPASGSLSFTVDQSYSDGSVVHWDEATKAGAAEPEHPAPVLAIKTADAGGNDDTALGLSIAALALGLVAVTVAALGFRRRKVTA